MNWRSLLPCGGIIGGAVTGWLLRAEPPGAELQPPHGSATVAAEGNSLGTAKAERAAVSNLDELRASWGKDGAVGIYELLAGVPAATLAVWLEEYLPPDTYSRAMERYSRTGICQALVDRLAERDPLALAAWINKIPPGYTSSTWLPGVVPGLLQNGSPEAMAALARLQNYHLYARTLELTWLAKRDPAAALQELVEGNHPFMPQELAAWLTTDSARALTFANAHPDLAFAVLAEVGKQGSAALNDFAAGLTGPLAQRHARRLQLQNAAQEGDAAALAGLLARSGRDRNDSTQDDAAFDFARLHPEGAEAVARQFADRPELCRLMIERLGTAHPARAAALMAEPFASGLLKDFQALPSIMREVSEAWSLEDPAAAQSWLRALPDDQRGAVVPFAGEIAAGLPDADWLALTRGLPVDHGVTWQLVQQAVSRTKDPAVLAEWCASFPDNSREHLLHRMRSELKDPAVVAAFEQRLKESLTTPPP